MGNRAFRFRTLSFACLLATGMGGPVSGVPVPARADPAREALARAYEAPCDRYDGGKPLITLDDIRRYLARHRITSAREFVTRMAGDADFDPFLSSHVLVHTSLSSQRTSADKDHPRILLFHRGVIFGITDHPTGPNNKIEIIRFDRPARDFAFHLVDFSRPRAADRVIEHPGSCVGCHGTKPLPLWRTYRSWPGVYTHNVSYFHVPNPELAALPHAERTRLERLWSEIRKAPYGPSAGQISQEEWHRLRALFGVVPRVRTGAHAALRRTLKGDDAAALNSFLNDYNFQRIVHELKQPSVDGRLRYAAMAALLQCEDLPGFLGRARGRHDKAWNGVTLADLQEDVRQTMTEQFGARLEYGRQIKDADAYLATGNHDAYDVDRIAGLRYLFEKSGVDVKRFSLNFAPGGATFGYGFSEFGAGQGGLRMAYCRFVADLVRSDESMLPLLQLPAEGYSGGSVEEERRFCGLLREKSQAAFSTE